MWNWNSNLNAEMNINKNLVDNFKKYAKISGTIFILLGLAGIIYPAFMSLTTLAFVSYLMIFAGIMAGWMTWSSNKNDWAGWLKSVLLVMVGLFMLFYPVQGVAAIGLLFAVYFLMDAFAGFGLAFSLKPQKIWWLWLINAITSLVLGILFIWGWPLSSLWLVGLFVGISLLFDGIALLSGGMWLDDIEKTKED
jgi:uncharacterized membrane protein HdeD (DUF308 family)